MTTQLWQGRAVFVTGATGLVGSWLIKDLLTAGAYVVALVLDPDPQSEFYRSGDFSRTTIVQGCVEDIWTLERALNEHEIDTVFHLAAQPSVGAADRFPLRTLETNIRGTYNLLEACRLHSQLVQRVVIASSDKAYGQQSKLPYTEDMPLIGRHPYEVSKSCADLIAQTYHETYGLPVAIARCGNIYGGGDLNWSRIVPHTVRSLIRDQRPIIRSDGTYVRDYIHVRDVTRAYTLLAEQLDNPTVKGEAFNFSLGKPVTVLELVSIIQRLMSCEHIKPEVRNCANGEIHSQHLDSSKARQVLDWYPKLTLEEGLRETIGWYRDYLRGTN